MFETSKSNLSPPRIVCAANRYKTQGSGLVIVPGPRHLDSVMHPLVSRLMSEIEMEGRLSFEEGFIDQHGKFYSRHDAWMVAALNDQIVKRVGGDGPEAFGLFSENLY